MKKILNKICKRYNCKILSFVSERSDMGCQCYEIDIECLTTGITTFNDSYWIGEPASKQFMINEFEKLIKLKQ